MLVNHLWDNLMNLKINHLIKCKTPFQVSNRWIEATNLHMIIKIINIGIKLEIKWVKSLWNKWYKNQLQVKILEAVTSNNKIINSSSNNIKCLYKIKKGRRVVHNILDFQIKYQVIPRSRKCYIIDRWENNKWWVH